MTYEKKLIKYKNKNLYIKNQLGGKGCDRNYVHDIHRTSYIKDTRNFIPFERSIFHYNRKYPVCSYSMWNKGRTQLYIPIPPTEYDKLYMKHDFYIRLIHLYYIDEDGSEAHDTHAIMWSFKHKKWYNIDIWPDNDHLLNDLFHFTNTDNVLAAKLFINSIYKLRDSTNLEQIDDTIRTLTDVVNSGDGTPSNEVLEELDDYSDHGGSGE